jgi:hypothetical protein
MQIVSVVILNVQEADKEEVLKEVISKQPSNSPATVQQQQQ